MKSSQKWIIPFIFSVCLFMCTRLLSDMPDHAHYWVNNDWKFLLKEISYAFIAPYLFFPLTFRWLDKCRRLNTPAWKEYGMMILCTSLLGTFSVVFVDVITDQDTNIDSVIISNITCVLMACLFYIFLRNQAVENQLKQAKNEQLESELCLLKSQYHPHFLFNVLNMVYFKIDEKNEDARQIIQTISDLLRYQLYTMDEKVDIAQEIQYVTSYIDLMKQRKSEKLKLSVSIDESVNGSKIYPLLFQPLIENAFKYVGGENPYIHISLKKIENELHFDISNSIFSQEDNSKKKGGLGVENLRKRLELLYPQLHTLQVNKENTTFSVRLTIVVK